MGAVYQYRPLVRTARTSISYVPRRPLASTAIRRAQEDGNDNESSDKNPKSNQSKSSIFSSMKNYFFGEKKPKVAYTPSAPKKDEGGLGADSIFAEELANPSGPTRTPTSMKEQMQQTESTAKETLEERDREHLQAALNPNPITQWHWERRMVAREIRKRGRLPKEVHIKRTERESLTKSHWFKTSVKKLGPLARQIAGKNIDEAILQMRFSKKKAAKDVLEHLQHAKNVAIVRSGMGLPDSKDSTGPITVILKSGERKKIEDPTSIYIQQAWVNRGPYGREYDHRAFGRINLMRPPSTGLSVLLKEEKTRIREWKDREAKALRQREAQLWTQLPDRKISAQNQYYSW